MPPYNSNWKFSLWMSTVETLVKQQTDLEHCGEIDQPFYDWFEEGISPQEACNLIAEDMEKMITHLFHPT